MGFASSTSIDRKVVNVLITVSSLHEDEGDKIQTPLSPKPCDEGSGEGMQRMTTNYTRLSSRTGEVENVDGDPPSSQSSERRADGRRWYLGWLSLNSRRFVDEFFFDDRLVLIDSAKS